MPPSSTTMVPYARVEQLSAKNRELGKQLAELKQQLEGLGDAPAKVTDLEAQLAKLKETHKAEKAAWDEERGLTGAGLIDAEGQTVARALYSRLPEESRPKTLAEWVSGLKAEGATVPAALKPYMGIQEPAAGTGGGSGAGAGDAGGAPPRDPPRATGTGKPPPAGAGATREAIERANAAFRTNPSPENRAALAKLVGMAT